MTELEMKKKTIKIKTRKKNFLLEVCSECGMFCLSNILFLLNLVARFLPHTFCPTLCTAFVCKILGAKRVRGELYP